VAPSASPIATQPLTLTLAPSPPARQLRCLSPAEMAERRRQGLCYNCDEPYVRGHKCQRLFFLEVTDFVDDAPNLLDDPPPQTEEEPLISFHAITGICSEDTMQLHISIGNCVLTALLDISSTHNFISSSAARRAGLHFIDSKGAHIMVTNGDRVTCRGLARDVAVRIGDEYFTVDCYTIPLDCYLPTLGPILWDLDDLCMAFWHQGRRILWKGIGSTHTDIVATERLHTARGSEPAFLDRLLDSFDDVFTTPSGLPPPRACDHRIFQGRRRWPFDRTGIHSSRRTSWRPSVSPC
jgi:hypothetical protein